MILRPRSRSRPGVVAPLASAGTPNQLPALLASATLELDGDESATLDQVSALVPRVIRPRKL
jgi:aryl-alcohol dehydrogenase-like predicted oxidoreductase